MNMKRYLSNYRKAKQLKLLFLNDNLLPLPANLMTYRGLYSRWLEKKAVKSINTGDLDHIGRKMEVYWRAACINNNIT
jgi:hypothetical protein